MLCFYAANVPESICEHKLFTVSEMNVSRCSCFKKRHFEFLNEQLLSAELTEVLPSGGGTHLICFGTGLIIPRNILNKWVYRLNFHGALLLS